ncbi:hypothetical protein F4780DRAFT_783908 [Xylariomycetidae sp. FL0641]|nr:hypothetical protein F4780DRAFT_783908 [Xylariomycetidae sp. FL0641]
MRVAYTFLALVGAAAALPLGELWEEAKAKFEAKTGIDLDPNDLLDSIENTYTETCHKTCLKIFPDAGPKQDYCMTICHHKHSDSDGEGDGDDGM